MTSTINKIIAKTADFENSKTLELLKISKIIYKQGYLTKDQTIRILKWKSPRPLRFYEQNSETEIETITKLAFQQSDDKLKIHILTALKGVNYPSASAILMFYESENYPVLDIRVWKQLHKNNLVTTNPNGQSFTLEQWATYLKVIRSLAKENNLTSRQVEKRLFDFDKSTQIGNLYK
jgi:thermostable 8-oxoguanine DNA glycosylase